MDPLSLGASIIAFVEIAERVIRACEYCIRAVQDAPKDMMMILGETTSLKAIIDSLSTANQASNNISHALPTLFRKNGPVDMCRSCLSALEKLLPTEPPSYSARSGRRITFAQLAWPLKESKARKLLAEISHHKSTLLLAITGDMIHDIRDIKTGVQKLEYAISDAQRQDIVKWLQCTNPSSLHGAAVAKHEPHTSAWLLKSPEWSSWLSDPNAPTRLLWIYGIPGAGKTVLAAFIIEQIKAFCLDQPGFGHAFYYCHYSHKSDEAVPFLKWTIGQLCRQAKAIPLQLQEMYDMGCEPNAGELEQVLEAIVASFPVCYFIIDAVDESDPREGLLALISKLAIDPRFKNVKLLATSRLYPDIEKALVGISTAVSIANALVDDDIRQYVHSKLQKSRRLRQWTSLLPGLEEALVKGAHGMFRWVECQIHSIERLRHENEVKMAINNLPQDLAETYVRIFEAIPEPDRPIVRRVLIWICGHADAPWVTDVGINANVLLPAALYDVYGPDFRSQSSFYDWEYLQELCGCLITSEILTTAELKDKDDFLPDRPLEPFDRGDGLDISLIYVSLAHYTVKEFLTSVPILQSSVSYFAISDAGIDLDFTAAIVLQAIEADPKGTATDWVTDREAYCLTLVPACHSSDPSLRGMLQKYFDPSEPHFARIAAIQRRLTETPDQGFYVERLAVQVQVVGDLEPEARKKINSQAGIFLNMMTVDSDGLFEEGYNEFDKHELLNTNIIVSYIEPSYDADSPITSRMVTLQGTVREVMR